MDAVNFTALFSSPTTRIENKSNFPSSSKTRQYAENHALHSHNSRDKIVHMTAQDHLSNSTLINSNTDVTEVHQMSQLHNNYNNINNSIQSIHHYHHEHEQLQELEHDEQRKLIRVTQKRNSHLAQEEEVVNEQQSVCLELFTDDCSTCSSTASTCSMSTFDESTIDTSCPYNNIHKYCEGNNTTTTNLKKSKSSSANSENANQPNANEVNVVEIFDMHKPSIPPCMITEKDRQRELRKLCTTRGDDTVSFRNYIDALLEPDVYKAIFFSLRVTLMVALPLSLIARLDVLANIFPAHVVMPLWGIVDCRFTISEQICFWVLTVQLAIFITIFGVIFNACNMVEHNGAWWCAVIFGSFIISLFGDVRCKRLVVLTSVIILQMEHMKGGEKLTFPLRVGRDMVLATSLALFQSFFPIRYVSTECDDLLARGLLEIVRNMKDATNAFWSHDPVETAQLLTKLTTEPLQNIISVLPTKFSFVMYEFWESTLRLELRRERLQLIKMFMPHIHTLQDSARSITLQKSSRCVRYTHHTINKHNYHQHSNGHKHTHGHHSRFHHDNIQYTPTSNKLESDVENAKCTNKYEMAESDQNNFYNIPSSSQLQHQEREQLQQQQQRLSHHHNHFRYNYEDKQFWEYVGSFIRPAVDYHLKCLEQVMKELGENLNPQEVANNVSFDDLRQSSADLHAVLQKLNFDILIKANRNVDPLLYITTIFFHHLLVRVAFHLIEYGDKMIDFDRRRYKTQWQRFTEFFFLDYWNKFWEDLPLRLTIATSRDVRIYKDAFKVACAYGVGVMFTTYTDTQNVYYFGMAILFAVALPTAGDTMIASVYRITGMACACSISYMAIWHTPNLPAQLAVALCGIFIALLFRDQGVYTHTAMYCAMLILPSLNSAGTKLVLLSRIVSNTFTVMAYYAIVVFIFPIDVLKLAKEAQVEALVSVTECFSELVNIISRPFDTASAEEREVIGEAITCVTANCAAVCGKMEQLGFWLPKAAMEPTSHGLPFPAEALRNAFSSMRRLSSAVEIMSLALQILYQSYKIQDLPFNNNNNADDKESEADSSSDASSNKINHAQRTNKNIKTVKTEMHEQLRKKYHAGQILSAIAPTMREINRRHWIVMRDFITAMVQPYEFSLERATRHLSSFLELNELLHHTFVEAHSHSIEALRSLYTEQVLHRTMTVAAKQQLLPPQVLTKSFDALTASVVLLQEGCNNLNNDNINNNNNNNNNNRSYGNEFIAFARDNDNSHVQSEADKLSRHSSINVEAIAESIANKNSISINEESGVTNGSIARNIALSFARRHRQQQERSRQSSIIFVSPKAESTTTTTTITAINQGLNERSNLFDAEHAFPLPLLSKDKVESVPGKEEQREENSMGEFNVETLPPSPEEIEEVLRGAERQAEQEVYTAYIARRPSTIHTVIRPEEAYDEGVNMSNYILVATDIFFAEAERLMKTMFVINKYARSRIREPKTKDLINNKESGSTSINVNKKKYK